MAAGTDPVAALDRLRTASRAFADATGVDNVVKTLLEQVLDTVDATGAVVVIRNDADALEVLASTFAPKDHELIERATIDAPWPLTEALRTGQPNWCTSRSEILDRFPALEGWVQAEAYISLPLRIGDRVAGVLGISFDSPQRFEEAQRFYLLALADMCAMVLDRHVLEGRRSEDRLRALVESNVIGVVVGDGKRILEANEAFLEMVGATRDDLATGLDWRALTHPDFVGRDEKIVEEADFTGRFGPYEKEFLHRDGRRVPVRMVGGVLSTPTRETWISLVEDLSEDRRVEEALRATTARLGALMRNAPVGFAFIDKQLRFQLVNDKLAEINGIPAEHHLGQPVREIVPDLADANDRLFRRVLAGETILETEVNGATPAAPNERHDWLVNYYPVRDDDGAILGIGATVIDVTDRNRLLLAERRARTAAETTAHFAEALSAITAAVANAADDHGIARVAGEQLVPTIGADAVLIARTDPDGRMEAALFSRGYTPDDIAEIRSDPDSEQWSTTIAFSRRTPIYYESAAEYLNQFPTRRSLVDRLGARAWTVVPLVAADHVLGFVVAMFRSPREFDPDERRFLATLGDVVAQAMLRARARAAEALARRSTEILTEAIAAERTRLAAVLHRMPAGLVVVDRQRDRHRVVLSNRRAAEILGPPPADDADAWFRLTGLDGRALDPADTALQRALRGDDVAEPEDAIVVRGDGTTVHVRTSAVPVLDSERRVTGAILVIEDVTDQARRERDAQLLARVSDLLRSVGNVEEVLEHVVALAVPTFADACGVHVVRGDALHLLAVAHYDEDHTAAILKHVGQPMPMSATTPVARAVRTGEPELISDIPPGFGAGYLHPTQNAWMREVLQPQSVLVVPLRARGRVAGALTFAQMAGSGRRLTDDDIGVATELATRCTLLLEQVIAHSETARARDRADGLQRLVAAMARAASVDAVVSAIVTEGVSAVDALVVNVLRRIEHDSSYDYLQTRRLHSGTPVTWHVAELRDDNALTEVVRTNRPAYYCDVAEYTKRFEGGEEVLALNDCQAVATLPLFGSDGKLIGAIGYAFLEEQPFDAEQRALLETVADVAAQSLDRAQLFERERDVASALQLALLPSALPELDDVVTEARYVAGGAGVSVGGDWYDVLRLADGRVGLLIGDVAGRGVEAATLMGKVRHAAAALAMEHASPAMVLSRVNEYLHTLSARRAMVTCCYMVLDHDRGTIRYASAGHPPAVIVEGDGEPRFLTSGRGVPLGVIPTAVFDEAEYRLQDATTIVLYTDGLIERRGEAIDTGLLRLLGAVRGHANDVAALCDHLTSTLLTPTSDDDVALLATRVCSVPNVNRLDLELPAESRRLHELRARVSRWLKDAGVASAVIPEVVIALNEAASNSMLHAYAGAPKRGHVHISLSLSPESVSATVTDEGKWRQARPDHDGRGIQMMHALMTEVLVDSDDHGTCVHMTRAIPV